MSTANQVHKPEGECQLESIRRLEHLGEAVKYLQSLDPRELRPEDYAEIEEAVLRVWARAKLGDELDLYLRHFATDIRSCLTDLYRVVEDTQRHVHRSRSIETRKGARGIACNRSYRSL